MFTCAINGDGQVYCWGQNGGYLLGNSDAGETDAGAIDITTPQPVVWD
jgi:alpha-tubulin suppressor-like RCC1 family protein